MNNDGTRPARLSNKPKNIRYHNQKLVTSLFRTADVLSVSEISEKINLSKTTVTKMMGDFVARGLIKSAGKGSSTDEGGKKPELFELNADYAYIVVLVLRYESGLMQIDGAVVDMKCRVLHKTLEKVEEPRSYEGTIKQLADVTVKMAQDMNIPQEKICTVTLGFAGVCDADNGIIYYPMYPGWPRDLPARADMEAALPFETAVYIDNDSRFRGYSVLQTEENRQLQSIAIISSGTRAGGCILENHALNRGVNGFVGEFGHMVVEPYSKEQCSCGGYGCFESMVSTDTVLRRAYEVCDNYPHSAIYQAAKDKTLEMQDVFAAAKQGDVLATLLMDRVIHYFSILIHNIVLVCDPSKFIIQGAFTQAGDYFLDHIREEVNAFPFFNIKSQLNISFSPVPWKEAFYVGAALYATHRFYNDDELYN